MQGVSKTDFENYVKANDAVLRNMQNQGQGTLPSQTVTNPREHVNAITTRSGKTYEGPRHLCSESTAQVPPPEDHDSIFIEIPKPKAKKTVQEPNSPKPNSYQPKLPYPERMKVREKDKPSAQQSRFMKLFKQLQKLEDPGKFLIPCALQELDRKNALANSGASINLFPHSIGKQLRLGALKPTPKRHCGSCSTVPLCILWHSRGYEPFSGSTTNHSDALPPSSSPVKTSDNPEEFADELTLLKKVVHEENFQVYSNPLFEFDDNFNSSNVNPLFNEMDEEYENENSNEGYFDSEGDVIFLENLLSDDNTHNLAPKVIFDHEPKQNNTSITFSPRNDPLHHEFAREIITLPSRIAREHEEYLSQEIDIFLVPGDLIPPGVENDDSEDEDNSTFLPDHELPILDHQDNPSSPRPPPEPPDVCLNFKPDTAMKNDEDFNQGEIVLSLNVEDVNSFTFVIWTFLPSFTYPEDSPVILSFSSEDLIFDPGIFIFHFSYLEPWCISWKFLIISSP
ncbi:hypothetical protein Tco_1419526 [Tanacetum coccineum]